MGSRLISLIDEVLDAKSTDPWYIRLAAWLMLWALLITIAVFFPLAWYYAMRENEDKEGIGKWAY